MAKRWREGGRRTATAVVAVLTAVTLAACSPGSGGGGGGGTEEPQSTEHFGYLVDTSLVTTNAGSEVGASSNTEALSGRLYPAVFVPGPSGQMIPNTDLVSTQVLPGANRQVIYTIAEHARYSDGAPLTCTDFLLSYKAGVHEGIFGSHLPQTGEVLRLDCEPGQKRFTVVFDKEGGGRWRHLFGPGSTLPAHAIAAKVGLSLEELHTALQNDDLSTLVEVAPVWRDGFNLVDFDPALQVTSGPFVIDRVGPDGEVVLRPNDQYYGDAPDLDTIVVWPRGTEAERLLEADALRVADIRSSSPDWVDRDDPENTLAVDSRVGDLTDTLMLGDAGVFATAEARRAFAGCVDQNAVAAASSRVSGVEVPPVALHSLPHNDPAARQLVDVTDPELPTDIGRAQALTGATIRIGYLGPDDRKAAMVAAIAESCGQAGITVEDASGESTGLADLSKVTTGQWGETVIREGTLDAVLMAVDPMAEFGAASSRAVDVNYLREAEKRLWQEVPSIPLAAQPRWFVIDRTVGNVVVYTGLAGIGWNMDRWLSEDNGA
ncbi:Bacterial extracellular solute-binding protein, family 5 [Corynebacterium comes]|uniref:Bacterial extracellular solute-binding protein, family 5 n=1 Tax=Corynebacterium comes TaxID=2675218 RepID=A0A6B8W4F1_9CORY|nr:ABC transporter substrate-binding protein [Corynebacterium comes]QGU04740.1 Bacterial extracellular solute-binding protein, family 5 [Corynebacterium comes]